MERCSSPFMNVRSSFASTRGSSAQRSAAQSSKMAWTAAIYGRVTSSTGRATPSLQCLSTGAPRASGLPIQLLDGVSTDRSEGDAHYSLADTGALVFVPLVPPPRRTLAWVDRSGRTRARARAARILDPATIARWKREWLLSCRIRRHGRFWIHRFDSRTLSRLTLQGHNWAPVWSRDGSQLIYASERNGQWQLKREALDGRAVGEVLLSSAQGETDSRGCICRWPVACVHATLGERECGAADARYGSSSINNDGHPAESRGDAGSVTGWALAWFHGLDTCSTVDLRPARYRRGSRSPVD